MKHFSDTGNCPYDITQGYEFMSIKPLYLYHHIAKIDLEIEPIDKKCFEIKPNILFYKVNV